MSEAPRAPTGAPTSASAEAARAARTASAPGKLLLAGEYAVLSGATAVVTAVDRRAIARREPRRSSPFLDALAAQLAARHGATAGTLDIVVDTSSFSRDGQKLGLGSSAAATVAAAALALADLADRDATAAHEADDASLDPAALFELAFAAHGDAQGARGSRGSGADIAASTYGGVLAYQLIDPVTDPSIDPLAAAGSSAAARCTPLPLFRSVHLLAFFTGTSADTVTMVGKVHSAGDATRASLEAIARASEDLARAIQRDDPSAILRAIRDGGAGIAALGAAAGYDIETAAVRVARDALARLGGEVKTTGAGGGDLAIAVVPREVDPDEAAAALIEAGCQVVPLSIDPRGARIDRGDDPSGEQLIERVDLGGPAL